MVNTEHDDAQLQLMFLDGEGGPVKKPSGKPPAGKIWNSFTGKYSLASEVLHEYGDSTENAVTALKDLKEVIDDMLAKFTANWSDLDVNKKVELMYNRYLKTFVFVEFGNLHEKELVGVPQAYDPSDNTVTLKYVYNRTILYLKCQ